jgi:hypothetical protein
MPWEASGREINKWSPKLQENASRSKSVLMYEQIIVKLELSRLILCADISNQPYGNYSVDKRDPEKTTNKAGI